MFSMNCRICRDVLDERNFILSYVIFFLDIKQILLELFEYFQGQFLWRNLAQFNCLWCWVVIEFKNQNIQINWIKYFYSFFFFLSIVNISSEFKVQGQLQIILS